MSAGPGVSPQAPAASITPSAPVARAEPVSELRLLVKLSAAGLRAAPTPEAIARWASHTAGDPVAHLADSGGGWHALLLQCAPSQCDGALQRLGDDTRHFEAVERDERKRLPAR